MNGLMLMSWGQKSVFFQGIYFSDLIQHFHGVNIDKVFISLNFDSGKVKNVQFLLCIS